MHWLDSDREGVFAQFRQWKFNQFQYDWADNCELELDGAVSTDSHLSLRFADGCGVV